MIALGRPGLGCRPWSCDLCGTAELAKYCGKELRSSDDYPEYCPNPGRKRLPKFCKTCVLHLNAA